MSIWWMSIQSCYFCVQGRPVTSLGHPEGRRVFWEGPKFFELCPVVSNDDQHIFPGGANNFLRGIRPPLVTGLVQGGEKLWFWMCSRQVSMLCHLCPFLSCVLGVSNTPVATPAHGLLGLIPSLRLRFILENASLLGLYICATTHGPTSLSC